MAGVRADFGRLPLGSRGGIVEAVIVSRYQRSLGGQR